MATARFLERLVARRAAAGPARRGFVDVDLRRGRVRLRRARPRAPAPRPEEQLLADSGNAVSYLRREADPSDRETSRSSRPRSTRSPSATTRNCALVTGAAYGIPTVALRFFNVYGPGQALSNPYTGVAAIFASRLLNGQAAGDLRGRPAVARLHPCVRHRRGHPARTRVRGGRRPRDQPRHRPAVVSEVAERSRRARCRHRAGADGQYRAGDIRHCYADRARRELLGFDATVPFSRKAWPSRCVARETRTAIDRVDAATRELEARGLTAERLSSKRADLAIIIVSTNEAHWLRAVPAHDLRLSGRGSLDVSSSTTSRPTARGSWSRSSSRQLASSLARTAASLTRTTGAPSLHGPLCPVP